MYFWLAVLLTFIVIKCYTYGNGLYVRNAIARGVEAQKSVDLLASVAALKRRDPSFDPEVFAARVRAAFVKVQQAWSAGDMTPARAFLSDGVMERFSLQLDMMKAQELRNVMEDLRILDCRMLQVESDPHFDTAHVSVRASAVDMDLSGGNVVRNVSRQVEEFVEVWSFLRRPGAKTLGRPGLMEGLCPNCGSSLDIKDAAKCAGCGSWVNSGEYDWVLAEITQACEWAVRSPAQSIPGFQEMARHDTAFNVQFLEDRASVAFWRWQAAHWEERGESLLGVATDVCRHAFLESRETRRQSYKNAAVGGVDVLACVRGDPFDSVHVLVKWSGEEILLGDGERRVEGPVERHHVFIFARDSKTRTDPRAGLCSSRCAGCGAPAADRRSPSCEYCGVHSNDGRGHWVLAEVAPHGLWKSPAVQQDWLGSLSPVDALAVLVGAMVSDGCIDPRELEFARAHARKHSIPEDRIDALVESARRGRLQVRKPQTPDEASGFMRGLAVMSLVDGAISKGEMKTLLAFGKTFGMGQSQVEALVKEERGLAFTNAKKAAAVFDTIR